MLDFSLNRTIKIQFLTEPIYIVGLAYYSAFDRCKNHFRSIFLSEVANFLLRFSSLSWTNFEKLISGKYKHFSISFQRYQNFYRTTNDWKVIDKNKNTAHHFDIYFNQFSALKWKPWKRLLSYSMQYSYFEYFQERFEIEHSFSFLFIFKYLITNFPSHPIYFKVTLECLTMMASHEG